jgi:ketosteroid isomerase-like protein
MIQALFDAIDARDIASFGCFLAPDCMFRFGNQPPVAGLERVIAHVDGFFDSVRALRHELSTVWETADALICHGMVTYTRHDGSELCVPFCNVLKLADGRIREYLIFADTSMLYRPDGDACVPTDPVSA